MGRSNGCRIWRPSYARPRHRLDGALGTWRVTGCYPYGGNLRTHGYAIICAVSIPVLSV